MVDAGRGGWELVARYAYLDYYDPNTPLSRRGRLLAFGSARRRLGSTGSRRSRILFNYNYAVPDETTTVASEASVLEHGNVHW